jgi:hypothetical protein
MLMLHAHPFTFLYRLHILLSRTHGSDAVAMHIIGHTIPGPKFKGAVSIYCNQKGYACIFFVQQNSSHTAPDNRALLTVWHLRK